MKRSNEALHRLVQARMKSRIADDAEAVSRYWTGRKW